MKTYQKYSDKALIPIMKNIIGSIDSEGMYIDDIENNFDELSYIITKELNSYLSDVDFEAITYFMALIIMNNDLNPPLKRPELKTYEITHTYQRVDTVNSKYQTIVESYIPLDSSILHELRVEGSYEPFDGDLIDEDVIDTEYTDDWIEDIEEI